MMFQVNIMPLHCGVTYSYQVCLRHIPNILCLLHRVLLHIPSIFPLHILLYIYTRPLSVLSSSWWTHNTQSPRLSDNCRRNTKHIVRREPFGIPLKLQFPALNIDGSNNLFLQVCTYIWVYCLQLLNRFPTITIIRGSMYLQTYILIHHESLHPPV